MARLVHVMRFVVQRSRTGRYWETWSGDNDELVARELAEQHANRGRRGERFRVLDADTLAVLFTVENA